MARRRSWPRLTRDLPLTPLAGRGIVITRPDRQAAGLAALIDAAGGHALRYATIEIEPLRTARLDALLGRLADYDVLVFISRNAVEQGLRKDGLEGDVVGALRLGIHAAQNRRDWRARLIRHNTKDQPFYGSSAFDRLQLRCRRRARRQEEGERERAVRHDDTVVPHGQWTFSAEPRDERGPAGLTFYLPLIDPFGAAASGACRAGGPVCRSLLEFAIEGQRPATLDPSGHKHRCRLREFDEVTQCDRAGLLDRDVVTERRDSLIDARYLLVVFRLEHRDDVVSTERNESPNHFGADGMDRSKSFCGHLRGVAADCIETDVCEANEADENRHCRTQCEDGVKHSRPSQTSRCR